MDTHKLTFRNSFNHVQYIIDKQHSTGCCHSTTTAHIARPNVLTRNKWERLCWERLMDLPLADTMWMVNIYKCLHFVITYPLVRLKLARLRVSDWFRLHHPTTYLSIDICHWRFQTYKLQYNWQYLHSNCMILMLNRWNYRNLFINWLPLTHECLSIHTRFPFHNFHII